MIEGIPSLARAYRTRTCSSCPQDFLLSSLSVVNYLAHRALAPSTLAPSTSVSSQAYPLHLFSIHCQKRLDTPAQSGAIYRCLRFLSPFRNLVLVLLYAPGFRESRLIHCISFPLTKKRRYLTLVPVHRRSLCHQPYSDSAKKVGMSASILP